ncbi:MAG: hypothetical protein LUF27_03765 [Lachnospiraceae bacterium]|nr:hypothetical protein [Lachnospiraceae bacterium]
MKKVKKGTRGYISFEKKKRFLQTLLMFILPIGIYIIGYVTVKSRLNLFTVIAILGCLPACKSMVGLIMILMQHSMPDDRYDAIKQAAGDLTVGYELVITAYEHTSLVEAAVVCGDQVVCFTPDEKTDPAYLEKHIRQILSSNGFTEAQVKVMKELKPYLQRVSVLAKNPEKYREGLSYTPDERYPGLSRDEVVYQVLLAISL